jgi:hypothetical protein
MAFPAITIKGNTPGKRTVVDRFQDLCQEHDQLTQAEVLDMLMTSHAESKDAPHNIEELKEKAAMYDLLQQAPQPAIATSPNDNEGAGQQADSKPNKKKQPAHSDIIKDIAEFKEQAEENMAPFDIHHSLESMDYNESVEFLSKLMVIKAYMRGSKPYITDKEVITLVVESVYEELTESKLA